jgi:hypothetical protein
LITLETSQLSYLKSIAYGMDKTMKTALTMLAVALLGCSVLCEQAQAVKITGDIGFFGTASASGASLGPPVTITFTNPWHALSGTGVYAGIPFNTPATFSNFTFTLDGASALLSGPLTPEWTFSFGGETFSFDLLSLTNGHVDPPGANGLTAMAFSGTGTVHGTGVIAFDDTPATWSLEGSGTNFNFTLSSSTTSSIPEPGVTTLLVLGCAVLAGYSLRRKRRAI